MLDGTDNAFSGSLGAIYEVSPLLRPYANYARAFRAPGMRERYESGVRGDGYFFAGSPEAEAEKADQFELGIKGASSQFVYQVAGYHNRIENYLTGQILTGAAATAACGAANAGNCKKTVNLGSVTIHGLRSQCPLAGRFRPLAERRLLDGARHQQRPRRAAVPDAGRRSPPRLAG